MSSSNNARIQLFPKDSLIFRAGDPGDAAYIIEEGRVLVYLEAEDKEVPLTTLGRGEIFGEMSIIDGRARSASVKAIEDCRINVVSKGQLLERIQTADPVVRLLMTVLLNRIRQSNNQMLGEKRGAFSDMDNIDTGEALQKIRWENQIAQGFENQEFNLVYQPIVSLADRKIIGCEALLRWQSPTLGAVSPNDFMDLLEESTMMVPVGGWILRQALSDLEVILNVAQGPFKMSVNVSGRQFTDPKLLAELNTLMKQHQFPKQTVNLELTERVITDGVLAFNAMEECRKMGFTISIDDFGTGFSSLSYLAKLPVNFLKVDRSFTSKMRDDLKTKAIVRTILFLSKALGLKVVAEGIETIEEERLLVEMGCDHGQGYLYGRPMPLEQLLALL
jgi:EAL domain-containing protein (putative c-di-GMP-specific phosphodiesterase class I)